MLHFTKSIAVFGATGAQGGPVAHALLDAGRPVRAIARTEAHLQPLAERGAQVFATDLTDTEALKRALDGVAGAFVQLPFIPVVEVLEAQARSIKNALVATNVPLVVFTTSGPVPTDPTGVASFDSKMVAERILRTADVPLIILQPVLYLGNLSAPFSAPGVVEANELRYPLPAEERRPWISVEDQAQLAITALERPDLAGRTYRIGEQLTGRELAEGLSAGLGRTIRYVPLDPEAFGASIVPFLGEQAGEALTHDYRLLGSSVSPLNLETETETVRRELGIPATPLSVWARNQPWEAAASVFRR
ncbi:MAG: NmrA family NAD(P)-binding protein [Ktedonobacteraceae bacterium]|nr:NmrA family NAD(P)-binding protein [Ktedonobacteraceae bacterium]